MAVTKLRQINTGGKNSSLTAKKATKPVLKFRCVPCLWRKFQNYDGKNKYVSTGNLFKISEWAGVDKIA